MFDPTDLRILNLLQGNARTTNAEIARDLSMAPSAVLERIRKLEQRGVIAGYEARIKAKAVGLGLSAFIFVRSDGRAGATSTGQALVAFPEVQEVHVVAGEDCYLVKVRLKDTDDLARFLRERLGTIPNIHSSRTTIVLETLKETAQLPLSHLDSVEVTEHA